VAVGGNTAWGQMWWDCELFLKSKSLSNW
jgi:hypothetical protein